MTEYTRQMHEKIMKIYRRETIRQYLWASIGFFPPVGALLLMIPFQFSCLSGVFFNQRTFCGTYGT